MRLKPLSARSIALSLILGAKPPQLTARELVSLGEAFEVAPATMRVALSRLVSGGDLRLLEGTYTLSERHRARLDVTQSAIHLQQRPHHGDWRCLIVVDRGRALAERTRLRTVLQEHRFAELREGVWMRPDNIDAPPTPDKTRGFTVRPDDEPSLCRELWDLDDWASQARQLQCLMTAGSEPPIRRLTAATAIVRLLRTDPVLPEELTPAHWPASSLREAYEGYRQELTQFVYIKEMR